MKGEHFRLGIFVIASVLILLGILFSFGVLERFKPVILLVTTFTEPIGGLKSGAAVEYRGLRIGSVGRIALATPIRGTWHSVTSQPDEVARVVVAEIRIEEGQFELGTAGSRMAQIKSLVDEGFRARLDTAGIGGPTFIQIDQVNRELLVGYPSIAPDEGFFVPSAPSAVGSIIAGTDTLIATLNQTKVIEKLAALSDLGPRLDRLLDAIDDPAIMADAKSALAALQQASLTADRVLADPRIGTVLNGADETMGELRDVIRDGRKELQPISREVVSMAQSLRQAAESLDNVMKSIERTGIVGDLQTLTTELRPVVGKLDQLVVQTERFIGENSGPISDAVRRLGRAAAKLQALLEEAQANPSRFIFGEAPSKAIPSAQGGVR